MKPKTKYALIHILLALFSAWSTSCTRDEDTGNETGGSSRFMISTRASSSGSMGVSEEIFGVPDATRPSELIQSWFVVFINESSKTVTEIITSDKATAANPLEEEEFSPKKLTGTASYAILGFANISLSDLKTKTGLDFTEGEAADPDEAEVKAIAVANNGMKPGEDRVPMSGIRRHVTITDNIETSPSHLGKINVIEVIRLFAKVEIKVRNVSRSPITVEEISFGALNKGDVALFPDYAILGTEGNSEGLAPSILPTQRDILLGDDTEEKLKCMEVLSISKIETGETGHQGVIGNESAVGSAVFYVRESYAALTHPSRRFFLSIKFKRADGTVSEEHYAATDALRWINRNDHIIIPVTVSDISVDWEVLFYPPIGGYPAVRKSTLGDTDFYTFSSQGKFVIRPVVKNADGSPYPVKRYGFHINSTTYSEGNATGTPGFLKKQPAINDAGEIIGELGAEKGRAIIDCSLVINPGETDEETRSRKIYIIRE